MAHLFDTPGSNVTVKWQPEPETRGTFTILSTCLITMALCVWSSVHLNLPGKPGSWLEAFLRRLLWITCSLFAPEFLILVAWGQRRAAQRISRKIEETIGSKPKTDNDTESQNGTPRHPWTMTHSFWAIMGGLAIDVNESDPFIPSPHPPKLTENGISLLLRLEPDLMPDVCEDELKDKSKGNSLTKLLACVQAAWFCASCLARVAQRLPLSLLELNTFAHAFCTVIVYAIWWKKPLDVERPLLIKQDRVRPLLAYMWMASKTSAQPNRKRQGDTSYEVGRDPEFEAIMYNKTCQKTSSATNEVRQERTSNASADVSIITVNTTCCCPGTNFYVNGASTRWTVRATTSWGDEYSSHTYSHTYNEPAVFKLSPADVRRWQLGQEALEKYSLNKPMKDQDLVTVKTVPEMFRFESKWSGNDPTKGEFFRPWTALGFSTLAACYGGLHALAWNARFPSKRQRKLWRISAIVIASPATLFLLLVLFAIFIQYLSSLLALILRMRNRNLAPLPVTASSPPNTEPRPITITSPTKDLGKARKNNKCRWDVPLEVLSGLASIAVASAVMVLYLPARAYIVCESFRMVFFLPPEAFRTTSWSQYFPHIT